MTGSSHLERALPSILEDVGRGPAPDYADAIIVRTAGVAQRPAWTFPEHWLPTPVSGASGLGVLRLPLQTIAAVALLVLALAAAAAVYVGGQHSRFLSVTGPHATIGPSAAGLVAFDGDGDIYVGDLATGTATAIVTGPTNDSRPIFAPDGKHIAFVRGDAPDARTVVVVLPDGSAERVITPTVSLLPDEFSAIDVEWTPDSGRIVVGDVASGQRWLYDALGASAPRRLTPPLRAWPRSPGLIDSVGGIASNFQPPMGDRVVATGDLGALRVIDLDLGSERQLAQQALEPFQPYAVGSAAWSPDGSMILFALRQVSATGDEWFGDIGLFVVDADGNNLRHISAAGNRGAWSPDGSTIAFQAGPPGSNVGLTIVDVGTGATRDLAATGTTIRLGLADPRGWTWSPEGHSILFLEDHALNGASLSRPLALDVETGVTTELPWKSLSLPSWQRVGAQVR